MDLEYRSSQSIGHLIKLLKGRSSRKLRMEFPELKTRHFWEIGYGCWTGPPGGTGNITDEMVDEYLEHH
ncbi:MAG: putative transposase [Spirosomataceae bacterium]|jgi:putative transposase